MAGYYARTELTKSRLRLTTTENRINRLLAQLKEENTLRATLEARINELEKAESK